MLNFLKLLYRLITSKLVSNAKGAFALILKCLKTLPLSSGFGLSITFRATFSKQTLDLPGATPIPITKLGLKAFICFNRFGQESNVGLKITCLILIFLFDEFTKSFANSVEGFCVSLSYFSKE